MKKQYIIMLLVLLMIPLVLAEQQTQTTLGNFKKDTCIQLIQNCNCTYVNISSVYDPNMDIILNNIEMQKNGSTFNYSFCDTSKIGRYLVNGIGDVDGDKSFSYDFYITTEGQGLSNYAVLLIVLVVAYCILIFGAWKEEIVFVALSSMVITILGIYININGIADMKNWITNAFGIINWGIGAYIFLRTLGEEAMSQLG